LRLRYPQERSRRGGARRDQIKAATIRPFLGVMPRAGAASSSQQTLDVAYGGRRLPDRAPELVLGPAEGRTRGRAMTAEDAGLRSGLSVGSMKKNARDERGHE
jgi:hypothetical protein